jgi:hypothetical protein
MFMLFKLPVLFQRVRVKCRNSQVGFVPYGFKILFALPILPVLAMAAEMSAGILALLIHKRQPVSMLDKDGSSLP